MMDELLSRLNRPLLKRIIEYFPGDEPFYLVGGVIRDALLNRRSYDLDFVTPGDALKIARHIADRLDAAYFPLDKNRKVARLILKPEKYTEIDGNNVGRIDFSSFQGVDLLNDLKGRDFTMNAIAAEVHQLDQLIDPLGGAIDLVTKRLRACSETSFLDDPVRILRAIRFAVDLELKISPDTLQLIRQASQKLPEVSNERLRDELFRILAQSHPSTALRLLDKLNVLEPVMPEICMLKVIEQSPPHVMDVWDHTMDFITRLEDVMEVLVDKYKPDKSGNLSMGLIELKLGRYRNKFQEHYSKELNPDRSLRGLIFLAGLYHDVGKYKSQKKAENGKIRFIEHEHIGSDLVKKRGISLRLSNAEIERMVILVKHHMRPSLLSHEKSLPTRRAVYRFFRDTGEAGQRNRRNPLPEIPWLSRLG